MSAYVDHAVRRGFGGMLTQDAELRCHEGKDRSLFEGNGSMSLGDERVLDALQSRIFVVQNAQLPHRRSKRNIGHGETPSSRLQR